MHNVLVVAYYFPPLGGIGSLRMCRFASLLSEYGWEATVLAPANGAYYHDPQLSFPEERVLRSHSFELSRAGKRVLRTGGTDTTPARPDSLRRGLQTAARRALYFPDAQVGWYWPAIRRGRAAIRERSYDAIFSSAHPMTAHLVARRLHRDTGIPWVAEYRDPFSGLTPGTINRRRAVRLERSIAREASATVMTSPTWADAYGRRWRRPVTVITNGTDGPVPTRPAQHGHYTLAHLGSLYPNWHDLSGVWEAIRKLDQRGSARVDRICFIGNPQPEVRAELEAHGLGARMETTGLLGRTEALTRLGEADALLLAGPKDGREILRGWIPAKLFEYLATDLPIVYVGSRKCDAAALLLNQPGCHVLDSRDVQGLIVALERCRAGRHVRDISSYTRLALTRALADILDVATLQS